MVTNPKRQLKKMLMRKHGVTGKRFRALQKVARRSRDIRFRESFGIFA